MIYATAQDLEDYVGEDQLSQLPGPAELDRLLGRASRQVDLVTLNRIQEDDEVHLEAANHAVLIQVWSWIQHGEPQALPQGVNSFSLGKLSMNLASTSGQAHPAQLEPEAWQTLYLAGLMYRGVGYI
jgi:hypothetical protein